MADLAHLSALEAQSIHILREAAACNRPALLHSADTASAVLLHLARKAFLPAGLPFPLLRSSTLCATPDQQAFDALILGRDEPAAQGGVFWVCAPGRAPRLRAGLSRLHNTRLGPGESMRVFPLAQWTTEDMEAYLAREGVNPAPPCPDQPCPMRPEDAPGPALPEQTLCGQEQALLDILTTMEGTGMAGPAPEEAAFHLPVQWLAREGKACALCGTVASGSIARGARVLLQPSGAVSSVHGIISPEGHTERAHTGQAVSLELADALDVRRGDVLSATQSPLEVADQFAAHVVWFADHPLVRGRSYIFRHATGEAEATVLELSFVLDRPAMTKRPAKALHAHELGHVKLALNRHIPMAPYAVNRDLGAFLLLDRMSGATLGAGALAFALRRSHTVFWHNFDLDKGAYAARNAQKPCVLWFTGLSASGKSSVANLVAKELFAQGRYVYILDGDNLRHGLNRDLGFTDAHRAENIRRAGEVAKLMVEAGMIVLATFISPFVTDREALRARFARDEFFEIFMDTPLELCAQRDPKGLYARALAGELPNFTGISSPLEAPAHPDLHLDGTLPLEHSVARVLAFWRQRCG